MGFVTGLVVLVVVVVCLGILIGIMRLGATALYITPYALYLGGYIHKNNLPKDFRKEQDPRQEVKNATQFYRDLLHLRKPTFD